MEVHSSHLCPVCVDPNFVEVAVAVGVDVFAVAVSLAVSAMLLALVVLRAMSTVLDASQLWKNCLALFFDRYNLQVSYGRGF